MGKGHSNALYINPTPFPKQGPVRASASNPKPKVRQIKTKKNEPNGGATVTDTSTNHGCFHSLFSHPPCRLQSQSLSRLLSFFFVRFSLLSQVPRIDSSRLSSLSQRGPISLSNYLFVFVLIVDEKSSLIFFLVSDYLSETISGGSCCVGERHERRGYSEMCGVRS
jgi:hypothetical protein